MRAFILQLQLLSKHRDGSKVLLTPESSVQCQKAYGSDIIIPLDELPPYHMGRDALRRSLDRTHRWELRSLAEHKADVRGQAMYSVGALCVFMLRFAFCCCAHSSAE